MAVLKEKLKKKRKKRMNPFIKLGIIIAIGAGLFFFLSSSMFDIKEYKVDGNHYYTDQEILTMGNCKTGGNIFWGTDYKDIKSRLEKDSYMEDVKIKRVLPDSVDIIITERQQTAAIVYGEKYVVIDSNGTVLRKTGVDPKITILRGLTISKLSVGEPVEVEEKVLYRQALELLQATKKYDMYFVEMELSEAEVRAYVLKNLVCIGTPENVVSSIKTGNLQNTVQELFERKIERGTIQVSGEKYISFTPKIE